MIRRGPGHEAELADVDLDDGPLGHDPEAREHPGLRVFLHADDREVERRLQLRVAAGPREEGGPSPWTNVGPEGTTVSTVARR